MTNSDVAKKSWLQTGGYFKDTHSKMDTLSDENTGFKFRKSLLKTSNIVELILSDSLGTIQSGTSTTKQCRHEVGIYTSH